MSEFGSHGNYTNNLIFQRKNIFSLILICVFVTSALRIERHRLRSPDVPQSQQTLGNSGFPLSRPSSSTVLRVLPVWLTPSSGSLEVSKTADLEPLGMLATASKRLDFKEVCLEYTAGLHVLLPTARNYSTSLRLQSSFGTPGLHSELFPLKSRVWFVLSALFVCFSIIFSVVVGFVCFFLCNIVHMFLTQSRGWGSAMGMVCRTSSSSCRARCKWISIQQGVSLMLCRG